MVKSGVTTSINTKHQCITAMKEYENKSLEVGQEGPVDRATHTREKKNVLPTFVHCGKALCLVENTLSRFCRMLSSFVEYVGCAGERVVHGSLLGDEDLLMRAEAAGVTSLRVNSSRVLCRSCVWRTTRQAGRAPPTPWQRRRAGCSELRLPPPPPQPRGCLAPQPPTRASLDRPRPASAPVSRLSLHHVIGFRMVACYAFARM